MASYGFCDYSNVHSVSVANKKKYESNDMKMSEVKKEMSAYQKALMNLDGVSNEDGKSKGIVPDAFTMMNIKEGITIPYMGDTRNNVSTRCMSCDVNIAATRLHRDCYVKHKNVELKRSKLTRHYRMKKVAR
jgi:hypothetical protein